MFNDGEQKVLDNYNKAITNVKDKLNLNQVISTNQEQNSYQIDEPSSSEMGKSMVRVRVDETIPKYVPPVENNFMNNNSASSFVIILCGVLVLIFLVGIITFSILKNLNI